jgi:hypothetical protein
MGVAFCGTLNCLDLGVATPVVRVRELIQPRSPGTMPHHRARRFSCRRS